MTVSIELADADLERLDGYADRWRTSDAIARIWRKDPTIWADPPVPEITNRLGWLDAPTLSRDLIPTISSLREAAVADGITDLVLCGMGGSSLAPEVFAATLPTIGTPISLSVMDSTHPDAVRAVAAATDPQTTWYIVASKSGGTIETMSFYRYFWELVADVDDDPGSHFIAITDPGTSLQQLASEQSFRATILADPDVGGRYSALTAFGLVPTGIIGADVEALLEAASEMAFRCGPEAPLEENPGFSLGVLLGGRALQGVDKVQFIGTEPTEAFGIWVEQLIAESTGKHGIGVVPIDGGPIIEDADDAAVVSIGFLPLDPADVSIRIDSPHDLAGAMFLLEFATAVAGAVLDINPFDQPDVQLAKQLANQAMEGELSASGVMPRDIDDETSVTQFVDAVRSDGVSYVSVQAYVPQNAETSGLLEEIRTIVSTAVDRHVTIGFGPRFLHSTGQLHKGGPSGGAFLQLTADTGAELAVPGAGYSFNDLITAQAQGDRAALADRDRTVVAVDLGEDVVNGLERLRINLVEQLATGS